MLVDSSNTVGTAHQFNLYGERCRLDDVAEILELGLRTSDVEVGRTLLWAAARRCGHRIQANLPPSLRTLLRPDQTQITKEAGLMGRVLDLEGVAAALKPAWLDRVRASGTRGGSFRLSAAHAGAAEVWVSASGFGVDRQEREKAAISLNEGAFAHLLFRGFDDAADQRIGADQDLTFLRVLFPKQDFVVWRADAF
jgi:hypothetical protein